MPIAPTTGPDLTRHTGLFSSAAEPTVDPRPVHPLPATPLAPVRRLVHRPITPVAPALELRRTPWRTHDSGLVIALAWDQPKRAPWAALGTAAATVAYITPEVALDEARCRAARSRTVGCVDDYFPTGATE